MKVLTEGHFYELDSMDGSFPQRIQFIEKVLGVDGKSFVTLNDGTTNEEVLDVLIACAFNYDAHSSEFNKLGRIPVLKARMNADLHMADDLKNTGKGNLFVIFGEPDIEI